MRQTLVVLGIVAATLVGACSKSAEQPASAPAATPAASANRKYLLETVDDAAVGRYYADGFDGLPLMHRSCVH